MEDEGEGKEFFNACIITHCPKAENAKHVKMEPDFFEPGFPIQCDPKGTYLVIVGFEKKNVKVSPEIKGKLTPKGVKFVESNMRVCDYAYFPHPIWEYKK